jgi:hypothetical protein
VTGLVRADLTGLDHAFMCDESVETGFMRANLTGLDDT